MNVIQALEQLKDLLPGDTPNKSAGEYCFDTFEHFIYFGEPELALDAVVYIAIAHHENGTPLEPEFWINAKRVALRLSQANQTTTYSETIAGNLETIDDFLKS